MSAERQKRSTKIPQTFKDYVTADEQSRLMVEEEEWLVVQFEDEGQVYCALPRQKVQPITLDGSEDDDDDLPEILEGDYVDAIWPGDGKPYDAKVIEMGTKTEMRALRAQLERDHRKQNQGLTGKGKKEQERKTLEKEKKGETLEKKKKEEKDQEKKEKIQKKEEAKAKRLEMERKKKAELQQAKESVKFFSKPDDLLICGPPTKKARPVSTGAPDAQHDVNNEILERIKALENENKQLKEQLKWKESHSEGAKNEEHAPGIRSPKDQPHNSKLVPLLPRSSAFLTQEQKNAASNAKPTVLVRNLMRVFFQEETLKKSNYGGGGPRGYQKLNTNITTAIIGYAMDPSIIRKEDMVTRSKLTETINKMCNEARRGISKI